MQIVKCYRLLYRAVHNLIQVFALYLPIHFGKVCILISLNFHMLTTLGFNNA